MAKEPVGAPRFANGEQVRLAALLALQRNDEQPKNGHAERSLRYDGLIGTIVNSAFYSLKGLKGFVYRVKMDDGTVLQLTEDCQIPVKGSVWRCLSISLTLNSILSPAGSRKAPVIKSGMEASLRLSPDIAILPFEKHWVVWVKLARLTVLCVIVVSLAIVLPRHQLELEPEHLDSAATPGVTVTGSGGYVGSRLDPLESPGQFLYWNASSGPADVVARKNDGSTVFSIENVPAGGEFYFATQEPFTVTTAAHIAADLHARLKEKLETAKDKTLVILEILTKRPSLDLSLFVERLKSALRSVIPQD